MAYAADDSVFLKINDLDLSKNILGAIFGNISFTDLSLKPSKISHLFKIFNLGLLIFAGGYISYSGFTSALNFAQHGGQMEQQKYSSWAPARMLAGASLLLPTKSGYSVMQAILMSVVLKGVGLANYIWHEVVDNISQHGMTTSTDVDNTDKAITSVYNQGSQRFLNNLSNGDYIGLLDFKTIASCLVYSEIEEKAKGNNDIIFDVWPSSSQGCNVDNGFCVGSQQNKSLCGSYVFSSNKPSINNYFLNLMTGSVASLKAISRGMYDSQYQQYEFEYAANALVSVISQYIENPKPNFSNDSWQPRAKNQGWLAASINYNRFSKQSSMQGSNSTMRKYDIEKIGGFFPKVKGDFAKILNAAKPSLEKIEQDYFDVKNKDISKQKSENKFDNPLINSGIQDSLKYLAKVSAKRFKGIDSVVENSTIFSDTTNIGTGVTLTIARDNALLMNARFASTLLGLNLADFSKWYYPGAMRSKQPKLIKSDCENAGPECFLQYKGISGYLNAFEQGKVIDPLFHIAEMGRELINTATQYITSTSEGVYTIIKSLIAPYALVNIGLKAGMGLLSAIPFFGSFIDKMTNMADGIVTMLFQVDQKSITAYLPVTVSIASIIFILGSIMSIYIPFVPFIVYIFCAIGWIISVIEAMVAAPLIALGVTHPQGHDLLGKSEQATILLLSVFVRPAAIIIGFVISIYLLYVAVLLLDVGFALFFANYLIALPEVEGIIFYSFVLCSSLLLYGYILVAVVHQVFGLTYKVPEQMMRWIGLSPEVTGVSNMLGEVRQGVQSGSGQAFEGAKQTPQAPRVNISLGEGLAKDAKDASKYIKNYLNKGRKNRRDKKRVKERLKSEEYNKQPEDEQMRLMEQMRRQSSNVSDGNKDENK